LPSLEPCFQHRALDQDVGRVIRQQPGGDTPGVAAAPVAFAAGIMPDAG
jgi:hypothetical protein